MRFVAIPLILTSALFVAGCGLGVTGPAATTPVQATGLPAFESFDGVVARMAPVVQDICRKQGIARNCKIRLYVAPTPDGEANAFQSVDGLGRPFVLVTPELLEEAQNPHEVALVLGHEAAHHILGHLARQQEDAVFGAAVLGEAAEEEGASEKEIKAAQRLGAFIGARSFSRAYELEADALGALITRAAGYDPLIGKGFFERIPDPGNHAFNTHPSNAQRDRVVRQALRTGQLPTGES